MSFQCSDCVADILFGHGKIKLKKAHSLIYFSLIRRLYYKKRKNIRVQKMNAVHEYPKVSEIETVINIGAGICIYFPNLSTLNVSKSRNPAEYK